MTPTLAGRWHTRLLLFLLVGLPVTILWSLHLSDWSFPIPVQPLAFLGAILIVGLVLDPVYIWIQNWRWDRDWPFVFQLGAMILEFAIVCAVVWSDAFEVLPWSLVGDPDLFTLLATHYVLVVASSFLALLGGFQILLIRWRFKGGELGRL